MYFSNISQFKNHFTLILSSESYRPAELLGKWNGLAVSPPQDRDWIPAPRQRSTQVFWGRSSGLQVKEEGGSRPFIQFWRQWHRVDQYQGWGIRLTLTLSLSWHCSTTRFHDFLSQEWERVWFRAQNNLLKYPSHNRKTQHLQSINRISGLYRYLFPLPPLPASAILLTWENLAKRKRKITFWPRSHICSEPGPELRPSAHLVMLSPGGTSTARALKSAAPQW